MKNVVGKQSFTHYPYVLELLKKSEKLFADIQTIEKYIFLPMSILKCKLIVLFPLAAPSRFTRRRSYLSKPSVASTTKPACFKLRK